MQDPNTFIDAGWDFVGETANGNEGTWRLCNDGMEYPKLSWQYLPGDFLCPNRIDFADFAYFADWWMTAECEICGGADLTGDGIVDIRDLIVENNNWLKGTTPPD